jgi:hypothetical protein
MSEESAKEKIKSAGKVFEFEIREIEFKCVHKIILAN